MIKSLLLTFWVVVEMTLIVCVVVRYITIASKRVETGDGWEMVTLSVTVTKTSSVIVAGGAVWISAVDLVVKSSVPIEVSVEGTGRYKADSILMVDVMGPKKRVEATAV